VRNERGFALVIILLVTALLVALTAEFVNEVYVDTSARQGFVDGQQASLLADSGMTGGITLLQLGLGKQSYTSLADLDTLGKMLQIADEKGTIRVAVEEESGKLNINRIVSNDGTDNTTFRPIADRLFKKLGLPPELLDAVADWIDAKDEPRPNGAETPYYQGLKPPYAAKNGYLETFEELRLVKGFDAKALELLRPYITVYPDDKGALEANIGTPVNINTAPKLLIACLDEQMTDELAGRIAEYRATTPLKSSAELQNNVPGMGTLAPILVHNGVIRAGEQKGKVFRILSQATVNETARVIEAVVRIGGQPPFLYWREY